MNKSFSVGLKYGLYVAAELIAYFLVLRLFGMHENPWLRLFNGIIMAAGIYFAIKYYKMATGNTFTYVDGFKTGLITGFMATIIFTGFMALYMFHIDQEFARTLLAEWLQNFSEGTGILVFIIFIEGLASTAILTLTCMQILKKSQNVGQQEKLVDRKRDDQSS